jgi:hypothetical protein
MRHAESSRKLSCERCLAGTGSPKYQNPLASRQGIQGIALLLFVRSALAHDHPDLYASYLRDSHSRRFALLYDEPALGGRCEPGTDVL